MNNARRKELTKILKCTEALRSSLESVSIDEQEAFDNLPESIQYSERGEKMEESIDEMDSICSELEDIEERILELTQ
ncbi:hypothetical protein [Reichenbachiella sp.]|uniref:hypothetical protein n=1 Tax=Reichenbachiella sp. TaxID=2184521 RepID=UPI003B599AFC